MNNPGNQDNLHGFRAESLLGEEAFILRQIKDLCRDLRYSTEGTVVSLDEYYLRLQESVDKLPRIELDYDIPPGTEEEYGIRLSEAYGQIVDDADRVGRKVLEFHSRLKNAERNVKRQRGDFTAWYILAANLVVKNYDIKFPSNQIKQLAESEFTRLFDGLDVQLSNLLSMVEHLSEQVKNIKKTAAEKYSLGKDQINLSYTSHMANHGLSPSSSTPLLEIDEEKDDEEVPAYVSKRPQIGTKEAV